MTSVEKIVAIAALLVLTVLPASLLLFPVLHTLPILIPLSLVALVANASLLFVVFKDIFLRTFPSTKRRYLWVALVFLCPPAILVYLPLHGLKPR